MQKYLEILAQCPLFEGIEESKLVRMLTCLGARVQTYDKKQTIFAEGSPARYIGIVLSGKAQTTQIDYYGNRSILSHVRPAEVFAEAFACAATPSWVRSPAASPSWQRRIPTAATSPPPKPPLTSASPPRATA